MVSICSRVKGMVLVIYIPPDSKVAKQCSREGAVSFLSYIIAKAAAGVKGYLMKYCITAKQTDTARLKRTNVC